MQFSNKHGKFVQSRGHQSRFYSSMRVVETTALKMKNFPASNTFIKSPSTLQ